MDLKKDMDHRREQQNMYYEDLLSKSRDLMFVMDEVKIKAHTDTMTIRTSKTMIAKMEQQIYEFRFT